MATFYKSVINAIKYSLTGAWEDTGKSTVGLKKVSVQIPKRPVFQECGEGCASPASLREHMQQVHCREFRRPQEFRGANEFRRPQEQEVEEVSR